MRIWFNHWFSTVYRLIELLESSLIGPSLEIIGSSTNLYAVYREKCSYFFIEPTFSDSYDYVLWCVDFCKREKIDVFFPRKDLLCISKHLSLFSAIGVKVLSSSDYSLVSLLEDKYETAQFFKLHNLCKVPPLFKVNTLSEFESAYTSLSSSFPHTRLCVKYNQDEGATSFRVIDDSPKSIHSLRLGIGSKIPLSDLKSMLSSVDSFDDLLVMPYLSGPEVSIDSLMTSKGFISVCRTKVKGRVTYVSFNSFFHELSEKFAKLTGLMVPYNLQLRKHNNDYYLLEVNTRLAGGTHKSNELGVNFPFLALCDMMNLPFILPDIKAKDGFYVSQIETPIILNVNESEDD